MSPGNRWNLHETWTIINYGRGIPSNPLQCSLFFVDSNQDGSTFGRYGSTKSGCCGSDVTEIMWLFLLLVGGLLLLLLLLLSLLFLFLVNMSLLKSSFTPEGMNRILFEVTLMPQGADIGLAAASPQNNLEHCQVHQKFQVPKMEGFLNLVRQFLGWGFPLHKPYIQHRWVPPF